MVRPIAAVLDSEEIQKIRELQEDMKDKHIGDILENVIHIECNWMKDVAKVHTYESLHNPYAHLISVQKQKQRDPKQESSRIRKRDVKYSDYRKRILKTELGFRTSDIENHKYFLSESTGYDVGLVMAAAHWLKDKADSFYSISNKHHEGDNIRYFEWEGMEKGIAIRAYNSEGNEGHYVLVRVRDVIVEENLAQHIGLVTKDEKEHPFMEKARSARECIRRMHVTDNFCILK